MKKNVTTQVFICSVMFIAHMNIAARGATTLQQEWDLLATHFEGNSRILKRIDNTTLLCKLKPTIFSLQDKGVIELPGIELVRTKINAILSRYLHKHGIKTSTIATYPPFIVMKNEKVPPLEIVVKGAMVGSPKHIYHHITQTPTRNKKLIADGEMHEPYVRFDWRNPLPQEDMTIPLGLANYFIDTKKASQTALRAYKLLRNFFNCHSLELLDICFFMNEEGDSIVAEISTDNMRFSYIGLDNELRELLNSRGKDTALKRAEKVLELLEGPALKRTKVIISGASYSGKTTLIQEMQKQLNISKLVDDATRPMRPNEKQGFPYHFISKEEFQEKIHKNAFFEWIEFNNNFYGVPKDTVNEQDTWVLDIRSPSMQNYQGKIPGMVSIYLETPPMEVLKERAYRRGDAEDDIQKRLAAIQEEDSTAFNYVIPWSLGLNDKIACIRNIINSDPDETTSLINETTKN